MQIDSAQTREARIALAHYFSSSLGFSVFELALVVDVPQNCNQQIHCHGSIATSLKHQLWKASNFATLLRSDCHDFVTISFE